MIYALFQKGMLWYILRVFRPALKKCREWAERRDEAINTQPRKSYYISGWHINPMIFPLKSQQDVMVVHTIITDRYDPRSGP
jgi:hypothetical protein